MKTKEEQHPNTMRKLSRLLPFLGAVAAFVVVLVTLFWGENAGLSDNGDFARVMNVNRIHPTGDGRSSFLFQQYYVMELDGESMVQQTASLFSTADDGLYFSPQFVFVQASKVINYFYNKLRGASLDNYNLAFLALLYALALAAAIWLVLRHLPRGTVLRRILAAALLVLLFCDAGYILYFQSFYGEALQFVSLLLAIGLWLRLYGNPRRWGSWILLYVTLYFFGGSKLANTPLACLFGIAALLVLLRGSGKGIRAAAFALCAALLVSQGVLYQSIPDWMENDTNYQAVFFGVLKNSETPQQDLQELGLDPAYAVLAGTHAYQPSYPMDIYTAEFRQGFYEKVSKVRVMTFYLRHPGRMLDKMDTALMCSAYIRPPYLGNLSSKRMTHVKRSSMWSWLRVRAGVLYHFPVMLPALMLLSLFALWRGVQCLRGKRRRESLAAYGALLALSAAVWAAWLLPIFGNGEADLSKHMFLFTHLIDSLTVIGVLTAAPRLLRAAKWCKMHWKQTAVGGTVLLAAVLTVILVHTQRALPLVQFGMFENKPLIWEVVREDAETMTLVTRDVVTTRPFDEKGSNLWSDSTLRGWLGSTFLAQFTPEEVQRLVTVEQREFLSEPYAGQSESGQHTLFWHFDPRMAADLADASYYKTTLDNVWLPTPELFCSVPAKCGADWWMLAPYGNNSNMERVVGTDGFILFRDAQTAAGVRPAVTVRK